MDKVWRVARTEYANIIRTKAFLISLIVMPLFMGGSVMVQIFMKDRADTSPKLMAVVDETGELVDVLKAAAERRNVSMIFEGEGEDRRQTKPKFLIEGSDATSEELSERVRKKELFAYLIIPKEVFDPAAKEVVRYHTATPTYRDLNQWTGAVLTQVVVQKRFEREGQDPKKMLQLASAVGVKQFGLTTTEGGKVTKAKETDTAATFLIPIGILMLMFMLVMMSAPALLNSVLEEKMQRISEILVSSVSPFELFLGKLLGSVFVSWTLSVLYLGGVAFVIHRFGFSELVPISVYPLFLLFQLLALMIFGSIFSAIGAACSELRDAQSLMMPAMALVMLPMFTFGPILEDPNGSLATIMTLFPPSMPFVLMMRLVIPPGPATWEIILGLLITGVFTIACVWAAGRIFRVGVLSSGQTPSFRKLLSWILVK